MYMRYGQNDLDFLHIACRWVIVNVLTTSDDSLEYVYEHSALHFMGILQFPRWGTDDRNEMKLNR